MATDFTTRPLIQARRGLVASGHYLATMAGFRILERGGNAVDAAAAVCFCLNQLEPQDNTLGGEVPLLLHCAAEGRVYALSGMGWAPRAFGIAWCRERGIDLIPGDGLLPACVPAMAGTWALALARFGTRSFAEVLAPAIELAEHGFPMYAGLREHLCEHLDRYTARYPSTGALYCPGGEVPRVGELVRNPDLARVLRAMCAAEAKAAGKGRVAGIEAARDVFYRGEVAERIARFAGDSAIEDDDGGRHRGLLAYEDLAEWQAGAETPVSYRYRGLDVHKCPAWTQGPVFLQQLALLEGFDLAGMGHNSARYLHLLAEVAKLAFADRESYYGDPDFDQVPMEALLASAYNGERRLLVTECASREMRPGKAGGQRPHAPFDLRADHRRALGLDARPAAGEGGKAVRHGDTTHLDVMDALGNMVSATPSGGWIASSPVIPGLGFALGTRAQMFYLNPARANALAPRKRPRATLTPTLVIREGQPYMAFGTQGGDLQDQLTLQFFLAVVEFGLDPQAAVEAPTIFSEHFPSSFYPREAFPGRLAAEDRLPGEVLDALRARGHELRVLGSWENGRVMGIRYDAGTGVMSAAVSPRQQIGYAAGW